MSLQLYDFRYNNVKQQHRRGHLKVVQQSPLWNPATGTFRGLWLELCGYPDVMCNWLLDHGYLPGTRYVGISQNAQVVERNQEDSESMFWSWYDAFSEYASGPDAPSDKKSQRRLQGLLASTERKFPWAWRRCDDLLDHLYEYDATVLIWDGFDGVHRRKLPRLLTRLFAYARHQAKKHGAFVLSVTLCLAYRTLEDRQWLAELLAERCVTAGVVAPEIEVYKGSRGALMCLFRITFYKENPMTTTTVYDRPSIGRVPTDHPTSPEYTALLAARKLFAHLEMDDAQVTRLFGAPANQLTYWDVRWFARGYWALTVMALRGKVGITALTNRMRAGPGGSQQNWLGKSCPNLAAQACLQEMLSAYGVRFNVQSVLAHSWNYCDDDRDRQAAAVARWKSPPVNGADLEILPLPRPVEAPGPAVVPGRETVSEPKKATEIIGALPPELTAMVDAFNRAVDQRVRAERNALLDTLLSEVTALFAKLRL